MSNEVRMLLRELVKQTMTRTRGQEAVEALRSRAAAAGASRILLDMRTDSLVTTSFVDELVRQAALMEKEGLEVVFLVPAPQMLQRFQKSVNCRRLSCRYRLGDDPAVRVLQPQEVTDTTPTPQVGPKPQIPSPI